MTSKVVQYVLGLLEGRFSFFRRLFSQSLCCVCTCQQLISRLKKTQVERELKNTERLSFYTAVFNDLSGYHSKCEILHLQEIDCL